MLVFIRDKVRSRRGISLLLVIMLILVLIMVVVISIPTVQYYKRRSEAIGCATALDTARRQLAAQVMGTDNIKSAKDAKKFVGYVMDGWDDLCPGGGNIYIVDRKNDDFPYDLVCGMHGADAKQRTRLNAQWVKEQIEDAVQKAKEKGNERLTSVAFTLNGEEIEALLTDDVTGWRRGSSSTSGLNGTMVRYGLAGYGTFGKDYHRSEGSLCYVSFVDDLYCANWSSIDGWTGDSYGVYGG